MFNNNDDKKIKSDVGKKIEDISSDIENNAVDESQSAEDVSQDVNESKVELEKALVETESLRLQLKKVLADYTNLEANLEKRSGLMLSHLKMDLAKQLIDVIDDTNFAINASKDLNLDEKSKLWLDGLMNTLNKMTKVLEQIGVTTMNVNVGDSFDPEFHEAVGMVFEGDPNKVNTVVQSGFMLGESVIRPARVIINKANPSPVSATDKN